MRLVLSSIIWIGNIKNLNVEFIVYGDICLFNSFIKNSRYILVRMFCYLLACGSVFINIE